MLRVRGFDARSTSRHGEVVFDWGDTRTWTPALEGLGGAHLTFAPDVAVSYAPQQIGEFAKLAVQQGVTRRVLLSGCGDPGALKSEQALKVRGADWTWSYPDLVDTATLEIA